MPKNAIPISKDVDAGRGTIAYPFTRSLQKTPHTKAERLLCERMLQDANTAGITGEAIITAIHYCSFKNDGVLLPINCDIELRRGSSFLSARINIEIGFQDGDLNVWAARVFLYPTFARHHNQVVPLTDEIKLLGYQILIAKPSSFMRVAPLVRIDSLCTSSFFVQGYRASAGITELGCDCYAQRHLAKTQVYKEGGLSLLTPFSGRGNGPRVLASENQMQNFAARYKLISIPNTYEAHLAQGHPKDKRQHYYWIDGLILSCMFSLKKIKLLTNNPEKIHAVREYDIAVTAQQHKDHKSAQYYKGINAEAKRLLGNHTT